MWRKYEKVAIELLNHFASEFDMEYVEGSQCLKGKISNTDWNIDAKGVMNNKIGFIVIECRRYTKSKQNQEKIAGLAYRIKDIGAKGGIIISPLGLQLGAKLIAEKENIVNVILDKNSTNTDYLIKFLDKVFIGVEKEFKSEISFNVNCIIYRKCLKCKLNFELLKNEKICLNCNIH